MDKAWFSLFFNLSEQRKEKKQSSTLVNPMVLGLMLGVIVVKVNSQRSACDKKQLDYWIFYSSLFT